MMSLRSFGLKGTRVIRWGDGWAVREHEQGDLAGMDYLDNCGIVFWRQRSTHHTPQARRARAFLRMAGYMTVGYMRTQRVMPSGYIGRLAGIAAHKSPHCPNVAGPGT